MASSEKKQNVLTLEFRSKVIKDKENGLSQRELARKYCCSKTQIQHILLNKCKIVSLCSNNANKNMKRISHQRYENINKLTLEWWQEARARDLPITGPIIQHKAKDFAKRLGQDGFTGSNGWLQSFCSRNNIVFRPTSVEEANVTNNDGVDWIGHLPDILKNFHPKNIYNAAETGLFFRAIPLAKESELVGEKKPTDRITILLCANALGQKELPLVINKSLKPKCFRNVDVNTLDLHWYASKSACMTRGIFLDWLNKFNAKMKQETRYVALLLDNAAYHPKFNELSNVKLVHLPTNTSSNIQPLDQGVIQTFKLHYHKRALSALSARIDEVSNIQTLAKSIDASNSVYWISQAWHSVQSQTIAKCFDACGIDTCIAESTNNEMEQIHNDLRDLGRTMNMDIDVEFIDEAAGNILENWEEELVKDTINTLTGPSPTDDIEIKEEEDEISESVPLSQCLSSISGLKNLARELGNNKLIDSLCSIESDFENEILLRNRNKVTKQNLIDSFVMKI